MRIQIVKYDKFLSEACGVRLWSIWEVEEFAYYNRNKKERGYHGYQIIVDCPQGLYNPHGYKGSKTYIKMEEAIELPNDLK